MNSQASLERDKECKVALTTITCLVDHEFTQEERNRILTTLNSVYLKGAINAYEGKV